MLFDGVNSFFSRVRPPRCIANDPGLAMRNVQHAIAIIDELNFSLDMGYGNVPEKLRAIYLFHKRQLVQAVITEYKSNRGGGGLQARRRLQIARRRHATTSSTTNGPVAASMNDPYRPDPDRLAVARLVSGPLELGAVSARGRAGPDCCASAAEVGAVLAEADRIVRATHDRVCALYELGEQISQLSSGRRAVSGYGGAAQPRTLDARG